MILAPRYIPRLASTVGLLTRYGLMDFAKGEGLLGFQGAALEDAARPDDKEPSDKKAVAFRERLVELGPAYIKLGQVLSTRPDLLPQTYIQELEHLQDSVPPMPFKDVEQCIEQELGAKINKLFASFEEKPLGSASLGQVHAAQLRDGRDVVIKVQRPGLREVLAEDIQFFRELAQFMTAHTSAGDKVDIIGVVQQVERALVDELDYRTEARNAANFRRSLAAFPHILIPRVIDAYTTHKVLTTQRVRGVKISQIPPITRIEYDFEMLADEFARAYLHQITATGHFHADPHPGNIFVVLPGRENPLTPAEAAALDRRGEERKAATPLVKSEGEAMRAAVDLADPDDPKLAMIDFGMTAHLTESMRNSVIRLLLAMAENQGDAAAEVLIEIGEHGQSFDRAAYVRDVSALIAKHADESVGDTPAGLVLYEMISIGYREGLKLPAELTLLAKALFNLDAVTRELDANFNPSQTMRDYASDIANERARRDMSPRRLFQMATATSDLVNALPRRLDKITERMARNDFAFRVDTPQLPMLLKGMEKIANRIFTGLVLAGLLIASSSLLQYWRRLGLACIVIAAALGLYMIATILINDRKRDTS
ncbi:MAG TPA: AarF/UbiB family protein [Gemmatimonadaceae bacterium]|nr:AarF/UbiB family protein [Gemmatimonadaceae bacterium]